MPVATLRIWLWTSGLKATTWPVSMVIDSPSARRMVSRAP